MIIFAFLFLSFALQCIALLCNACFACFALNRFALSLLLLLLFLCFALLVGSLCKLLTIEI